LARLEWLGMEEVGFGLTGMARNVGSRVWPDWNGLDWRKSVLAGLEYFGIGEVSFAGLEWLGMEEVGFSMTGIAWNGGKSVLT
jgi:hypothetical protein